MIALMELEERFNLSNWKRKLGNKRTKAGKHFWLFVLFNYQEAKKGNISYNLRMVCEEYSNIFYRPYEAIVDILTKYENLSTASMREKLNIEDSKKYFALNFKKNSLELEQKLRKWLTSTEVSFDQIAPEAMELIDLDFLDHRHPHLPLVSKSYKRLLDSANHCYKENKLIIDRQWELKPSTVKNKFNGAMDKLIRYKHMIRVVDHLKDYVNTSYHIFRAKTRVEGPTEAVRKIFTLTPEAADYTDKQLKYHLKLNYADLNGGDFKNDSVRKAIKTHRDEH